MIEAIGITLFGWLVIGIAALPFVVRFFHLGDDE